MKEKHKKSIDLCWATRDALHALMLNLYAVIFWSDCRQHIIEISHYSYVGTSLINYDHFYLLYVSK